VVVVIIIIIIYRKDDTHHTVVDGTSTHFRQSSGRYFQCLSQPGTICCDLQGSGSIPGYVTSAVANLDGAEFGVV
jgi:hypothetical protein